MAVAAATILHYNYTKMFIILFVVVWSSQYTRSVPIVSSQGHHTIDITNTPSLTTQHNTSPLYHLIGLLQQQLNSIIYSVQQVCVSCSCVTLCVRHTPHRSSMTHNILPGYVLLTLWLKTTP